MMGKSARKVALETSRREVRRIRRCLVFRLGVILKGKLRDGKFTAIREGNLKTVPVQMCLFGVDPEDNDSQISYDKWGLYLEGYTDLGIIEAMSEGGATITLWDDLSVDQLLFAYEMAAEHYEEL